MFGATEYAVGVDVWSVGTILMELLLGHLPFQGQDSTQQHLVEIMKLLGTPTDRDLQAMRATCSTADLPKLKPFPWERIFAPSTPAEAIDLAQRLLRYDPDQRLSASQALAHPFFDGAQELVENKGVSASGDGGCASSPSSHGSINVRQWEEGLEKRFKKLADENDIITKTGQTIMQRLEEQFKEQPLHAEAVGQVMAVVQQEIAGSLKLLGERAKSLQKALSAEVKQMRFQLPFPPEDVNGSSNEDPAAVEKRLEAELAKIKDAKNKIEMAASERADLLLQIKAAQAASEYA